MADGKSNSLVYYEASALGVKKHKYVFTILRLTE